MEKSLTQSRKEAKKRREVVAAFARTQRNSWSCVAGAFISFQSRIKVDFTCSSHSPKLKHRPRGSQHRVANQRRSEIDSLRDAAARRI